MLLLRGISYVNFLKVLTCL